MLSVRKHPAPEGTLRLFTMLSVILFSCQKAPSTRRCIKTILSLIEVLLLHVRKHPAPEGALRRLLVSPCHELVLSQKAPSTRRCIKTRGEKNQSCLPPCVRKYPAPEGALRRIHQHILLQCVLRARKHPAPEGALRPPRTGAIYHPQSRPESTQHHKVH